MQTDPAPTGLRFLKAHGIGNDYVVVRAEDLSHHDAAAVARTLCARHVGVGADGLLSVGASREAAFRMRMWNPDGSEAEMCGNGLRCAARAARQFGMLPPEARQDVRAETGAGILVVHFHDPDADLPEVSVEMGQPVFGDLAEAQLPDIDTRFRFTQVHLGNPHVVAFVEDPDEVDLPTIGRQIEHHPFFPDRTNVEFVRVLDRGHLEQRTWERGAGETLACGTGACAVLAAAVRTGRTDRDVQIRLRGGSLTLSWPEGGPITMRGPAVLLYSGHWEPS